MTAAFVPVDAQEREEIRTQIDENMCVEAGAGTGKTTVLVDRIVQIVRSGRARVEEIAVITFTEKAAGELAARVREQLEVAREAAAVPEERLRFEAALRDLNRAHVETIHAFAAGLLRERPVEAGVDPGFAVLADLPAQLAFEKTYADWIAGEMAQDPPPPALLDALNLGLDYACVREAADALHRHRDALPLGPIPTEDPDIDGFLRTLADECKALGALEPCAIDETDGALEELRRALDMQRAFEALRGHPESLRRAIAMARRPRDSAGSQAHWQTADDCRKVKRSIRRVRDALGTCADAMKQAATAHLLVWLQGFVEHYKEARKQEGKADFDDLLIWARDLVRGNAEVRRDFQQQYRCILVDEFQDTDPLQAELIVWLCEDGSGAQDWRRARLRPGSLFVVGDPKQSIYRFRRADIAMYDDVKGRIFGGRAHTIVQNFRSAAPIIAWVNERFTALMKPLPGVQPDYIGLQEHPDYAAPRTQAVNVVRCVIDGARVPELRAAEANALASMICAAVSDGAWTLRDGRAAAYRDIAMLIPSRAELETYEEALARAGVPYRHEGGRTFFLRQEVRELIAILRAIDDPSDQVAAVAALRSPAFGLSDEDLLLHRAAGGGFHELRLRRDAAGPVPEALRLLGDLRRLRHARGLPDIVRTVLDRTQLIEAAMLQPQGEQAAANLLKLVDQARAFAAAGGGGLRGFVRWLKENTTRTSDETDAAISEETDDVVRIVTVHASKGLEFPVVVFANMNTQRSDRTRVIADRAARRLHVKLGKVEQRFWTPGWDGALAAEQVHDDAEQRRLLYVAATRAKDRLVVPVFVASDERPKAGELRSANDLLRIAGVEDEAALVDGAAIEAPPAEAPVWRRPLPDTGGADVERVCDERAAWRQAHDALVARASSPLDVRTASSLKDACEPAADGDGAWRGRATEFGTAVHALLERIDLRRPDDATAMAQAIAAEFGLRGREDEIARIARNALDAGVIRRALRSTRVLREVAFTAPLPAGTSGLAEGRMDLLFVEDGAIVIVDFKTDAVSRTEVEERAASYRTQAQIYAWAAGRTTGMRVREVILLFARPGVEHATRVDAAFLAEAEAVLSRPDGPA